MIRILKRDIERVMKSKKIIRVAYFTDTGKELALKLFDDWDKAIPEYRNEQLSLNDWVQDSFENHLPILFIGAVGIAVRAIAPFVNNKLKDSAVVVTDELGLNVIPILSGHFGGANVWASPNVRPRMPTLSLTGMPDQINCQFVLPSRKKVNR